MHAIGNSERISSLSDAAVQAYRQMTKLEPNCPIWFYNLACAQVDSHTAKQAEGPLEYCVRTTGAPESVRALAKQKLNLFLSLLNSDYDDYRYWLKLDMWPVAGPDADQAGFSPYAGKPNSVPLNSVPLNAASHVLPYGLQAHSPVLSGSPAPDAPLDLPADHIPGRPGDKALG